MRLRFKGLFVLAAAAAALLSAGSGPLGAQERRITTYPATDLPGFDYRILKEVPLSECLSSCLSDTQCKAFTYNESAQWCFLKSDVGERTAYPGATSGEIVETFAETPAGGPLPLPDLSFLPDSVVVEARQLEAEAEAAVRTDRTVGRVTPGIGEELVREKRAPRWYAFGRNLLDTKTSDWQEEELFPRLAAAAGYQGLTLARSQEEQANGLVLLANAFQRQSLWRPAIEAYRTALPLTTSVEVARAYQRLRSEYGFRILDYSIDSDAAAPRMCVQFSETIEGDASRIEPYVSVDGIPRPVVSVEENQVCIDGLEHGERYRITMRAGIPSTVGESLETPASYTIYVRDRTPLVRFSGNDYVLPKVGGIGIPVVTVNTDKLDMRLLRIGDRSLAETIRSGDFRRDLSPWEADQIEADRGVRVWAGEMPVERELNKEVVTAFPVSEAAGPLEPGVYILTARPVESTEEWEATATQWFVVSDLGLTAMSGDDGVDVFVRSLATAEPVAGAQVKLVARNDMVLATDSTGPDGHVRLAPQRPNATGGMTPTLVTAALGTADYAFLSLAGAAFELSDRGVEGRAAPGPLDAFLYTERGVYRPGETVHLTTLLRDDRARAVENVPVTLVITRPDGVEARRIVRRPADAGGFAEPIELLTSAQTGTWRVAAYVDPDAPQVGSTSFLVEDFVPQRIEVTLEPADERTVLGGIVEIGVDAQFLYGAPAADLIIEGEVTVKPADSLEAFPGYRFGIADDEMTPVRAPLYELPRTGSDGRATVLARLPATPETTRPLQADITVRVREPSGRTVGKTVTVPVVPAVDLIGVKPRFSDGSVSAGATAAFDVIAVTPDLERRAMQGLEWQLVRIERDYQWYRRYGRWQYEPIERTRRIANGTVDASVERPGQIAVAVDWGRYRLEVTDPGGRTATSVVFNAGWVSASGDADTPDALEIHLDRDDYAAGATARVTIEPQFAGKALIAVLGESVEHYQFADVPAEGATVELTVGEDWGAGAYVAVTLFRPGEAGQSRMPARAIGVAWLSLDKGPRTLDVALDVPDMVRPRQTLEVPVHLGNLDPGEPAFITLAAVDVGILNLTGYEPPDAVAWYLGQRRLGVDIRDLYGDLIDSYGATLGRIRSGGGGPSLAGEALPPTQAPVALFYGVGRADETGEATATFELPAFNGTLRLMAVAWTATKVGNASQDLIVRDPVVVAGSLPRFLAPGDRTRMRFDIDNVDGPAGSYTLSLAASEPVVLDEPVVTFRLDAGAKTSAEVPLSASSVGTGEVVATLAGPGDLSLEQSFTVPVRAPAAPVTQRSLRAIAAGETTSIQTQGFSGLLDDTVTLSLSVTRGMPVDVPGLLTTLDRFPYGCAEQTTSRALPLLYLNEVAASFGMAPDTALRKRIADAIQRVLSFQDSTGAFGLWYAGAYDLWLTAYVMDFLTRARELGYEVPEIAMSSGLDRLQNELSYVTSFDGENGNALAYATYVLARNGRAAIGDLRYFADEKLDEFPSPLAQAQLGAALTFVGDDGRANAVFRTAALRLPADRASNSLADYGTPLRDAAAVLALAAESRAPDATLDELTAEVKSAEARGLRRTPSTQEAVWLLLAAHALQEPQEGLRLTVDGIPYAGRFFARHEAEELGGAPIEVRNDGSQTVELALTVRGTPAEPPPAAQNGLSIERRYYTLDGEETSPANVAQNDRMVVVLTANILDPAERRLLLADLLPAGFEIENPSLVSGSDLAAFAWASSDPRPEHAEFRDDRFVAAWTVSPYESGPLVAAYVVRAVSPGTFVHPAAQVEDMYEPGVFARTDPGTVSIRPTR